MHSGTPPLRHVTDKLTDCLQVKYFLMCCDDTYRMPISSTVYSLAALLVRPAQSIAPFIIVMVLTHYGYKVGGKNLLFWTILN